MTEDELIDVEDTLIRARHLIECASGACEGLWGAEADPVATTIGAAVEKIDAAIELLKNGKDSQ